MPLYPSANWGHLGVVNDTQFATLSAVTFALQQVTVDNGRGGIRHYLSDGTRWSLLNTSVVDARPPLPGGEMASITMAQWNQRMRRMFHSGSRAPALAPVQPPAHGLGASANAYATCARSPVNGKVYFSPQDADTIGVWDPVANTWATLNPANYGLTAFSNSAFGSTVATDDGLIVCIPYAHSHFVVYDVVSDTMFQVAHGLGAINAFGGGAIGSDNATVVCAPFAATNVGLFNIRTRVFTSGVAHGEGAGAFECCAWVPGDEFIFSPLGAGEVARYNLAANTITKTQAHGAGANAFQGIVPLATGKYFLVPFNATTGGLVDPKFTAGSGYSATSAHGVVGTVLFCGGGLMADGRVLLYPRQANNYVIYDPYADSWTVGVAHGGAGTDTFIGGCMLPGGQFVMSPMDAAGAELVDTFASPTFETEIVGSSIFQRY